MARGDQIYVMRPFVGLDGVYEHHGIDCGDGTVIHYSKATDVPTVRQTSLAQFSMGNPVFVKRQSVSFIPDIVMERAASRLGEQDYNLMTNNCEHFANWAKTGRNESEQLKEFGLGVGGVDAYNATPLIREAAQTGDPVTSMQLFDQALRNISIAQAQLQPQFDRVNAEATQWHRVAQLALKQGREDLARAALERKVKFRKEADAFQEQLDQLDIMRKDIDRNRSKLLERVQVV